MFRGVLIGYKAISDALGRLCAFAIVVCAVRWLSTVEFGVFSLAWATGWIVAIAGDLGLQMHLTRRVARQPEAAPAVFHQLMRARLRLTAVTALLAAAVGLAMGWSNQWIAVAIIVSSQLLGSLVEFHYHLFRGLSRSDLEATINLVSRALTLAAAALVLWKFGSLLALAVALFVGQGLTLAVTHRVSRRLVPLGRRAAVGRPPIPVADIAPIGAGIILSALYFRVDLFFLDRVLGAEAVAYYSAVFRLIDGARLLPAAAMAVVFPEFCRPGARRAFVVPALVLFGTALLIVPLGSWWSSPIVVGLFGQTYSPSADALRVLLMALPALYVNLVLTHQLIAVNRHGLYAMICGVGFVLAIGLNSILVPRHGIWGAAAACVLREWALTVACVISLSIWSARRMPAAAPEPVPDVGP